MFENLGDKLSRLISNIGRGVIKESDIEKFISAIRDSLLDADTHPDAVEFLTKVLKEEAVGTKVHKALNVQQQLTKLVHKSLARVLGNDIDFSALKNANRILIVGLQGSGKTTTVAKLARYFKLLSKNPLVSSLDFSRPAAVEQLRTLCNEEAISFYEAETTRYSKFIKSFEQRAKINQSALTILDTAGRANVDKELMKELRDLNKVYKADFVLLVLDSMVGRQVVDIARDFNEFIPLNGFILTKMDSDTKGGAALSAYYSINKPIYFIGTGEHVSDFDEFYPDRIASRILDLGDMLSVAEKLEKEFDEKEQKKLEEKLRKNQFDIEDFFVQLKQIKKLGSVANMLSMLPGGRKLTTMFSEVDTEGELKRVEAIINSMTVEEKRNPSIINPSRKKRIAGGSGTSMLDVNKFLKSFDRMKKMMKSFNAGKMKDITNMFGRIK